MASDNNSFDFATSSTSLIAANGFTASNATFVNATAKGKITNTANNEHGRVYIPISTEPGKYYDVECDLAALSGATAVHVSLSNEIRTNHGNVAMCNSVDNDYTLNNVFLATRNTTYLVIELSGNSSGNSADIDDLKVYEVIGHLDGDCYIYNTDVDSWSFGMGRLHLGHSSGTKEMSNMINVGTLYQSGYITESKDITTTAIIKTWEYKNQSTDRFKIITKITDLGSPESKKSILGIVVNTTQASVASAYNLKVSWRHAVDLPFNDLITISRTYDSTVDQTTETGLNHRLMFEPPAVKDIKNLQLKIEGSVQGDFGINDISLIFRKYRTSSVNTFMDE